MGKKTFYPTQSVQISTGFRVGRRGWLFSQGYVRRVCKQRHELTSLVERDLAERVKVEHDPRSKVTRRGRRPAISKLIHGELILFTAAAGKRVLISGEPVADASRLARREAGCVSVVFHLLFPLFTHLMNTHSPHSPDASRPVCLFRKRLVCLLFHRRRAYLDQTFNSATAPVSPPPKAVLQLRPSSPSPLLSPLPLGSLTSCFIYLFPLFFPLCLSWLGIVEVFYWLGGKKQKKTMRTRQGFVAAEMHF